MLKLRKFDQQQTNLSNLQRTPMKFGSKPKLRASKVNLPHLIEPRCCFHQRKNSKFSILDDDTTHNNDEPEPFPTDGGKWEDFITDELETTPSKSVSKN